MSINMRGCQHEYPIHEAHQCTHSEAFGGFAMLYFVSFLFLSGIVTLNLILGIVYYQMELVAAKIATEDKPADSEEPDKDDPAAIASLERHKELVRALRELEDKIEQQTRDIVELQHDGS